MAKKKKIFEIENRYCQICGEYIRCQDPLHRCKKKKIKKINKKEKEEEKKEENEEEIRTFDDKLIEFEEYFDSDSYYDNDIEED